MRGFPLRDASALLDALLLVALCLGGAAAGRRLGLVGRVAAGAGGLLALAAVAQLAFERGRSSPRSRRPSASACRCSAAILAEHRTRGTRARAARGDRQPARARRGSRARPRARRRHGRGRRARRGLALRRVPDRRAAGRRRDGRRVPRLATRRSTARPRSRCSRLRSRRTSGSASACAARRATRPSLEHPNVVAVLDAGAYGGREYIAMALVEGRPLHDLVGTPQLTTQRIAEIVTDVAAGLDHAHEPRRRAPRRQAAEHPRRGCDRPRAARRLRHRRRRRAGSPDAARRRRRHGRLRRPGAARAGPSPTGSSTSTRSAACSSSCSPAGCRSSTPRSAPRSMRTWRRPRRPSAIAGPTCARRASTRSSRGRSRRPPRRAGRAPARSRAPLESP